MCLANDALYIIRGGLGDQQSTRWSDKFILSELNRAIQRMLAIFKRNALDYGMGRTVFTIAAGADSFPLPADFRGVVGLYQSGKLVTLKGAEELETITATIPLAVWAVDGSSGNVKNAPTADTSLTLRYWQAPADLSSTASTMPWNGVFDGPLCDYVRLRLANYDEMTVSQDMQLMQDLENNMLTLAISRNPTVKEPKGWLA